MDPNTLWELQNTSQPMTCYSYGWSTVGFIPQQLDSLQPLNWRFPKMGVSPFLDGVFPYKPTILDTPIYGNPQFKKHQQNL